jgi:hypothetical protein
MTQLKVLLKKENKFSRGRTQKNADISSLIGFIGVNLR